MRRECVVQRQRWRWLGGRWKHLLVCSFIFASIYVNSENTLESVARKETETETASSDLNSMRTFEMERSKRNVRSCDVCSPPCII